MAGSINSPLTPGMTRIISDQESLAAHCQKEQDRLINEQKRFFQKNENLSEAVEKDLDEADILLDKMRKAALEIERIETKKRSLREEEIELHRDLDNKKFHLENIKENFQKCQKDIEDQTSLRNQCDEQLRILQEKLDKLKEDQSDSQSLNQLQTEIDKLNDEITKYNDLIKETSEKLRNLAQQIQDLHLEIEQKEKELELLNKEIEKLENIQQDCEKKQRQLENKRKQLENHLADLQKIINEKEAKETHTEEQINKFQE
ncbi:unnamed protein product, partial [Adineta ricciae]